MTVLNFKSLSLDDKPLLDSYLRRFPPDVSELTFTNLFAWSDSKAVSFTEEDNHLLLFLQTKEELFFMAPIGPDPEKVVPLLKEYARLKNIPFYIKKAHKSFAQKCRKLSLTVLEDRDNFDYIYLSSHLAHLEGRKYDGKRGFIKKFHSQYDYKYVHFTPEHIHCCLPLAEQWLRSKNENDPALVNELAAIKKAIRFSQELNLIGGFICIDKKTVAFTFGESLNPSTFVIHFEKADPDYTGSYQAINQFFIQNEVLNKYKYVNREQDLGIPAIRKAKLSYQPCLMIHKYIITEKMDQ